MLALDLELSHPYPPCGFPGLLGWQEWASPAASVLLSYLTSLWSSCQVDLSQPELHGQVTVCLQGIRIPLRSSASLSARATRPCYLADKLGTYPVFYQNEAWVLGRAACPLHVSGEGYLILHNLGMPTSGPLLRLVLFLTETLGPS